MFDAKPMFNGISRAICGARSRMQISEHLHTGMMPLIRRLPS